MLLLNPHSFGFPSINLHIQRRAAFWTFLLATLASYHLLYTTHSLPLTRDSGLLSLPAHIQALHSGWRCRLHLRTPPNPHLLLYCWLEKGSLNPSLQTGVRLVTLVVHNVPRALPSVPFTTLIFGKGPLKRNVGLWWHSEDVWVFSYLTFTSIRFLDEFIIWEVSCRRYTFMSSARSGRSQWREFICNAADERISSRRRTLPG